MNINIIKSKFSFENLNKFVALLSALSTVATGYFAYTTYSLSRTLALAQLSPNFYIASTFTSGDKEEITESIMIKNLNSNSSIFNYTSQVESYLQVYTKNNSFIIPLKEYFIGKSNSSTNLAEVYYGFNYNHSIFYNFYDFLKENKEKCNLSVFLKTFVIITYTDSFGKDISLFYDVSSSKFIEKYEYDKIKPSSSFPFIFIKDFQKEASYDNVLNQIDFFNPDSKIIKTN